MCWSDLQLMIGLSHIILWHHLNFQSGRRVLAFSLPIALFGTHTRTSPTRFLGTHTTGPTQGIGPITGSIMSKSCSLFSSASTCFRRWNGTRRCCWAIGCTLGFTCSLILVPLMCPSLPSNIFRKLSGKELVDWADVGLSVFRLAGNANYINPKACAVSTQRRFSVLLLLLMT